MRWCALITVLCSHVPNRFRDSIYKSSGDRTIYSRYCIWGGSWLSWFTSFCRWLLLWSNFVVLVTTKKMQVQMAIAGIFLDIRRRSWVLFNSCSSGVLLIMMHIGNSLLLPCIKWFTPYLSTECTIHKNCISLQKIDPIYDFCEAFKWIFWCLPQGKCHLVPLYSTESRHLCSWEPQNLATHARTMHK